MAALNLPFKVGDKVYNGSHSIIDTVRRIWLDDAGTPHYVIDSEAGNKATGTLMAKDLRLASDVGATSSGRSLRPRGNASVRYGQENVAPAAAGARGRKPATM